MRGGNNLNFMKSLEMELNQPAEDIDRISINEKAAAIFSTEFV